MVQAVFPRWANAAFVAGFAVTGLFIVVVPGVAMIEAYEPPITGEDHASEQPVAFDHRHHVLDDGIDCRYCHDGVERSASAGMPPTSRCLNCHVQVWNHAPALDAVRLSFAKSQPIRWRRVYQLPDFVFFHHAAHLARGVGCASCHGRVDQMAKVYQAVPLTMGWCLDCHRHPENALRPEDRITDMAYAPSAEEQHRIGTALVSSGHISPPLDCSGCHR